MLEQNKIRERLLFSETSPTRWIAESLENELASKRLTIAVAEGTTGGSLIDALTIHGSTRVIHVSGIFYSRQSKELLGVPREVINTFGEYSPQTALAMAESIQRIRGDDVAIATVGKLDTSNNASFMHVAFRMKGRSPWFTTILLSSFSRRAMKSTLSENILSLSLLYLHNKHEEFSHNIFPKISLDHQLLLLEYELLLKQAKCFVEKVRTLGFTIETIESCTGGALANAITDISGSSDTFQRGWLAYDENIKTYLGVPLKDLAFGNVYSEHVALAMAQALFHTSHADIVLSTTGLMDTLDMRPYHNHTKPGTMHAVALIRGVPYVDTFSMPIKPRAKMKLDASLHVLALALKALEIQTEKSNILLFQNVYDGA